MKKFFLLLMMVTVTLSGAKASGTHYALSPDDEDYDYFDKDGSYFGPTLPKTEDEGKYKGAYYTGRYDSPFKTYLGKTDEEIQKKLDDLWNHYFKGDNYSNSKVYYETNDGAYIKDINNNDVRSEGMSYGMMICVQTNHKTEFDKLWKWTKAHMWHNPSTGGDGYFSWSLNTNGSTRDQGCAPDGEIYFMMSLLFAANRWNDEGYMKDAQAVLKACWKGNGASLFNEQSYIVVFQPTNGNNSWSDPSYSLPAFVDLFSRWSDTNKDKWTKATSATRDHLYKSSNTTSGLFSDYNNFDGTPHSVSFNSDATKYMYDAMRCAMNFGMDYYLFGADAERQTEMAKRIIDFFEKDGYKHARFNWDGSNPSEDYTLGQMGCNAVACYALMGEDGYHDQIVRNLQMAWNGQLMTGQYRYYEGLVHYLSMLHLCGSFKIWKPVLMLTETDGVTVLNKHNTDNGDFTPVTFRRTFTKDVPSTVCLPLSIDAKQAAALGKFYTFAGIDKTKADWEVIMQETDPSNQVSGKLSANTPYLFIPAVTGEVVFYGFASNTISASTTTDVDGWSFIGTYDKKQWDDAHHTDEIGSIFGFAAEDGTSTDGKTIEVGKFFQVSGGANSYIMPFRAYMKYTSGGASAPKHAANNLPQQMKVRLVGTDGTITGITEVFTHEGMSESHHQGVKDDSFYTLDGRKLSGKPTQKGLYIVNGHKVVR